MNVSIKKLTADDWRMFAEIRLLALKTDPRVFGSNYETESKFTETDWRNRLQSADSAIFILFDGEKPFGVTGVSVSRDDPSGRTAVFWGSWLAPEYRGRGFSKSIYETRIEWAKKHPTVQRIIVSHRRSNAVSKFANQKHGFRFTGARSKIWSDGKTEDEIYYELKLDA